MNIARCSPGQYGMKNCPIQNTWINALFLFNWASSNRNRYLLMLSWFVLYQSPIPCSWSGSSSDKSSNGLWTEGTSLPDSGCEKPLHNCLSLPPWWEWRLCFKIVMKQGGRSLSLPTGESKAGLSLVKIFDQAKISLKASPIGSLISALLRLKLCSHFLSFLP